MIHRTGAMRIPPMQPVMWSVIQEGGSASDWVLTPTVPSRVDQVASAATDFVRIRTWETPVKFFHVSLTQVFTGTCEPIG